MSSIGRRMANKHRKNAKNSDGDELSNGHPSKGLQRPLKLRTPTGPPLVNDPKDQEDLRNAETRIDGTLVVPQVWNQEVLSYIQDIGTRLEARGKRVHKAEQRRNSQRKKNIKKERSLILV